MNYIIDDNIFIVYVKFGVGAQLWGLLYKILR